MHSSGGCGEEDDGDYYEVEEQKQEKIVGGDTVSATQDIIRSNWLPSCSRVLLPASTYGRHGRNPFIEEVEDKAEDGEEEE